MFYCVVLLGICVAGVLAAPGKVCAPDQWSAVMFGSVGMYENNKTDTLRLRVLIATDYKKKMEARKETSTFNGKSFTMWNLKDFNTNTFYQIDPINKKCVARSVTEKLIQKQHCIGDADLKLLATMTVGDRKANTYEMPVSFNGTSLTTVMVDDFSPVTSIVMRNFMNVPQLIAYQYGNYSDKIPADSIIEIPSYCKSEEEMAKRICAPEQVEFSAVGSLGQVSKGMALQMGLYQKYARDYKNKMEAASTDVFIGDTVINNIVITHWNKHMMYVIDHKDKTCIPLPTPVENMTEMCNDSDKLKAVASFKVDGKQADMYRLDMKGIVNDTITVIRDNFEFISAVVEQEFMKVPQMLALQYGNMTSGIKDPKVFELPDYCIKDASVLLD